MKEILEKYINGKCSEKELLEALHVLKGEKGKTEFDAFVHHHWQDLPLEKVQADTKAEMVLDRIHHAINLQDEKTSLFQQIYVHFSRIAAVIFIPLCVALFYFMQQPKATPQQAEEGFTTITTPNGMQGQVTLPDGSLVWLNADSKITYNNNFQVNSQRKVALVGEGYFDVVSDSERPFLVTTQNKIAVKVLGTKFNISAYKKDNQMTVALEEGKVKLIRLLANGQQNLTELKPNEVATFDRSEKKISLQQLSELRQFTAWRTGKLILVNEPLSKVLRKMKRKFDVDYEVKNKKVLEKRITGTFTNQNLNQFLKILSIATPIKYKIEEGTQQSDTSYSKRKVIIY